MLIQSILFVFQYLLYFYPILCQPDDEIPSHYKSKELFYIYDSEEWAKLAIASIYKRDPNERLDNQYNHGAGPMVDASAGAYHTDQYQLFSMIYYRALTDPRRTLDPSKATSFFIPYDFALDSAYYKNCARSHGVCYEFRKCPLAPQVEKLLQKSPYYQKNHGKDHVLIVGMNYAMDHYILKPKCKSLIAGTCSNCTKFAIDDYSYMYSGDVGIKARGNYWHAIPFPSDFHWTSDVLKPFPWEETNRPILASYTGSEKSFYGPSRRLRSSLAHYCSLHSDVCMHRSYGLNGTRYSFKVDGHNPLSISKHSVFCFQPTGDLMTRKGLFDSILQGCIPVVFDPLTAKVMYTWHWEESFWKDILIELDFHPVSHRYLDPIVALQTLYNNNRTWIEEKQRKIRSKVFELQYSLHGLLSKYQHTSFLKYINITNNPSYNKDDKLSGEDSIYLIRNQSSLASSSSSSHGSVLKKEKDVEIISYERNTTWPKDESGNYLRDAYEITMDYILAWHSGREKDVRNATVPECWDGWLDTVMNRCRPGKGPESTS